MATDQHAFSEDKNATSFSISGRHNKPKRLLAQSKAVSLRTTPSVDNSRGILLSATKMCTEEDDVASLGCPEHAPTSCNCEFWSRKPSRPSQSSGSAVSHTPGPLPLTSGKSSQQDVQPPGFYRPKMEHTQIFNNKEVDEAVIIRFNEVSAQLNLALRSFWRTERIRYSFIGINIMVLGATEDVAKPWIVVHSPYKAEEKTWKFLQQKFIRNMCQATPTCQVEFDIAVCRALKKLGSETPDEVFIEQDDSQAVRTRTPLIKVMQSGTTNYATMGGFVIVTDAHGKKSMYGLTAGHVLPPEDWSDSEVHMSSEEDEDDDDDDDEDHRLWASLGHISKASYSSGARDHDWALIELTATQAGRLIVPKAPSSAPLVAARPAGNSRALIWNDTMVECTVSPLPARTILLSGSRFVDVDVLHPTTNEGICLRHYYSSQS
jgi:hypothetical protein